MSALSDYLEAKYPDHTYNGLAFTPPAGIYIALYSSDPTDADAGTEVSGGGYARARVYPNGGGAPAFALAVTDGVGKMVANADDIVFPTATAPWGTITHFGAKDAASGGNLLHHGALDEAQVVGTGADQNYATLKLESVGGVPTASLNAPETWITLFMRVATAPSGPGEAENVVVLRDSANAVVGSLRLSADRTLDLYDSTGTLASSGTTVLWLDAWYRLELYIATGTTGAYELRVDGALEYSGTMDAGINSIDHVCPGNPASAGTTPFTVYFDDVALDDASFSGNVNILRLAPNANGTYTAWTNDWTVLDEVPYSAGDYCTSTTPEAMESVNLVDAVAAGIPSEAEILAVKYTAVVRRTGISGAGFPPWAFFGIVNGEDDLKDTDLGIPATSTWEMRTRTWATTWQVGYPPWTAADIDTLQVGVVDKRVGQTAPLQCTMLMAEVVWRPPIAMGSATVTGKGTAEASAGVPRS